MWGLSGSIDARGADVPWAAGYTPSMSIEVWLACIAATAVLRVIPMARGKRVRRVELICVDGAA
jgi:hypothetical protein